MSDAAAAATAAEIPPVPSKVLSGAERKARAREAMLHGPIVPTLVKLALPTIGVMVAQTAVGIAETYYVSFLGTDVLYIDQREWFIESDQKWEAVAKRPKITLAQARALERELGMVRGIAPTVTYSADSVRRGARLD